MIWLVDAVCALLVVAGITLAVRRPHTPTGDAGERVPHPSEQPRTYIQRIAGVMLATFGFAFGLMVTLFHFA